MASNDGPLVKIEGVTMSGKKSSAKPGISRAEVKIALQSLVRKGFVVARKDVEGRIVYFTKENAPPLGPFRLETYRRTLQE
jgi:hypothetical protein